MFEFTWNSSYATTYVDQINRLRSSFFLSRWNIRIPSTHTHTRSFYEIPNCGVCAREIKSIAREMAIRETEQQQRRERNREERKQTKLTVSNMSFSEWVYKLRIFRREVSARVRARSPVRFLICWKDMLMAFGTVNLKHWTNYSLLTAKWWPAEKFMREHLARTHHLLAERQQQYKIK